MAKYNAHNSKQLHKEEHNFQQGSYKHVVNHLGMRNYLHNFVFREY